MKYKALVIFILCLISFTVLRCQHNHTEWHFGYAGLKSEKFGLSSLIFNEEGVDTAYVLSPDYELGISGSVYNTLSDGKVALSKYPHDTYLCHPRRILLTISELLPLN
jgi:hypothetical protein